MLKYLTIFLMSVLSCGPAQLKTDIITKDTGETEDRSWANWDECGQEIGQHPCNFTLLNHKGEKVELYDYYGKVIVIDFSTMWCGVCINIASEGDKLVNRYGKDNVIWLTVLIENQYGLTPTQEDLQNWVDMANIQVPVLGSDRNMIDHSAKTGYPITSWPTLVVIDKEMVLKNGLNGWSAAAIYAWVDTLV
tara:strand:+ start:195 stop:770 length:576 start_codon:yes stop_codon:yes gene_type:complete